MGYPQIIQVMNDHWSIETYGFGGATILGNPQIEVSMGHRLKWRFSWEYAGNIL